MSLCLCTFSDRRGMFCNPDKVSPINVVCMCVCVGERTYSTVSVSVCCVVCGVCVVCVVCGVLCAVLCGVVCSVWCVVCVVLCCVV